MTRIKVLFSYYTPEGIVKSFFYLANVVPRGPFLSPALNMKIGVAFFQDIR